MESLWMLCALLVTILTWMEWRYRTHRRQWKIDREEIERKGNDNKRLREAAQSTSRQIVKLQNDLSRRIEEVGEWTRKTESATGRATDLQLTLDKKDQEINALNGKVIELQAALDQKDQAIGALNGKITELQGALSKRGQEIDTLNGEAAELRATLTRKNQEVGTLAGKITKYQATLTQRDQEIGVLRKDIESSEFADKRLFLQQVEEKGFEKGKAWVWEHISRNGWTSYFSSGSEEGKPLC